MKKIVLLLLSFSSLMIFSQTNSEIKQIIQNYDVEAIKNLEIEFKKHKEEVDNRINAFLEQNKTAKRIIVTTAKTII